MKRYYSLLLLLPLWNISFPQENVLFQNLTLKDGLSNEFVTSFCQDELGFMWLGTANGLNRYDGYEIRQFHADPEDSLSLSHPTIWTLCNDGSKGVWIGTAHGLSYFDAHREKFRQYFADPKDKTSLSSNAVECVYLDSQKNLWVGTENGLNLKRKDQEGFERFFSYPNDSSVRTQVVRSVIEDQEGTIWVSVNDTLKYLDRTTHTFTSFPLPINSTNNDYIRVLYQDRKGYLWVGTNFSGLFQFDPSASEFVQHYSQGASKPYGLGDNRITAILEKDSTFIWIGTNEGGLSLLNRRTKVLHSLHPDPFNPQSLNSENVRGLFEDKDGNVWVGTSYGNGGANLLLKNKASFKVYTHKPGQPNSLNNSQRCNLIEDRSGKIWIGTTGGGINIWDPEKDSFTYLLHDPGNPNSIHSSTITSLALDLENYMWAGDGQGISRIHIPTGQIQRFESKDFRSEQPSNVWIRNVESDQWGNIWVGTYSGLFRYDPTSESFIRIPLIPNNLPQEGDLSSSLIHIRRNVSGDLWVSSRKGLILHDPLTDSFVLYPSESYVQDLSTDRRGRVWIASIDGIAILDSLSGSILPIDTLEDLRGLTIHAMLIDSSGTLWMSTEKGIYSFDPETQKIKNYMLLHEWDIGPFLGGRMKRSDGELFFGGTKGFISFHPSKLSENPVKPSMVITDLQLLNAFNSNTQNNTGISLKNGSNPTLIYLPEVVLPYSQQDFSIHFAGIDFTDPSNNRYQFQLKGYQKEPNYTGAENRVATYTNLDPGTYTFHVKGANNEGIWNEEGASLRIVILPPWYRTWWAYILYILAISIAAILVYRILLKRRLAQAEARRLKDLDEVKNRMFTYITHEFRSPLTAILGVAQELHPRKGPMFQEWARVLGRNGQRLLNLVNQMLDLAKLEAGELRLSTGSKGDIIPYLRYVIEAYHSQAESKQIRLHVFSSEDQLVMDYEPERLMYVLSNLLSNAIKFTSSQGKYLCRNK